MKAFVYSQLFLFLAVSLLFSAAFAGPPAPGQPNPGDIPMTCHLQALDPADTRFGNKVVSLYLDPVYARPGTATVKAAVKSKAGTTAVHAFVVSHPYRQAKSFQVRIPLFGAGEVMDIHFTEGSLTDNVTVRFASGKALPVYGTCRISFH